MDPKEAKCSGERQSEPNQNQGGQLEEMWANLVTSVEVNIPCLVVE